MLLGTPLSRAHAATDLPSAIAAARWIFLALGSSWGNADASWVCSALVSSSGIAHIVAGGKRPPRVHWAPLAVLSPGPRLAGALSRGTQVLRAIPLEIGEHRHEIVVRQTRGVVRPGFPGCSDVYWSDRICLR